MLIRSALCAVLTTHVLAMSTLKADVVMCDFVLGPTHTTGGGAGKWGPGGDGTGATVTWSLMADGISIDESSLEGGTNGPSSALSSFMPTGFEDEIVEAFAMSKATIYRHIKSGDFPAPTKIGSKSRWHVKTLEAWVEEQEKCA